MKKFNLILVASFVIFGTLVSCSNSEDEVGDQFVVDTAIDISVKDIEGNDLLDPNYVNSLNENEFKLFYEINGEQIEYYEATYTYPKGFNLYEHENEYRLKIFSYTPASEVYPVTYIMWNDGDLDTIKSEIKRTNNSEVITKVWFNGELMWEGNESERHLEIIK